MEVVKTTVRFYNKARQNTHKRVGLVAALLARARGVMTRDYASTVE
ncbi:hypothetical protein GCM10007941_17900 [Amphritea balenae]|nr:hypothetical protein GCM10007941_17900 [Amphritea balenae]